MWFGQGEGYAKRAPICKGKLIAGNTIGALVVVDDYSRLWWWDIAYTGGFGNCP